MRLIDDVDCHIDCATRRPSTASCDCWPDRAMLAAYDGRLRLAETGARLQKPRGQRSSVSERSDGPVPQRRQLHHGLGFAGADGGWVEATQWRVSTAAGSS